jgi:endonuclease-3 related protein
LGKRAGRGYSGSSFLPPKKAGPRLITLYRALYAFFGPRGWWPGQTPFEVMIGAVLTQNTAWSNVEKAIANLRAEGLLSPESLAAAPEEAVAQAIRSSGYYNLKKDRLLSLVRLILDNGPGGDKPAILSWPMERLRPALLAVRGVGPETADSIVLYAAGQPSFVVDTYTRRLISRHGLASGKEPYEDIRAWLMESLPHETALYNEFHALIVAAGHNFCGPRVPLCPECPLGKEPNLRL